MLNPELIINRLALIKQLHKIGIEQTKQFEPIAAFSILSFHDSIEMFLKLLAEHNDIKTDKFNFLDYWTEFPNLTLKESMRNLNARRVNIKHKGLLPSKSDIEVSKVNTNDFFEQNVLTQFGLNYNEISLLILIKYESVKKELVEAQRAIETKQFEHSIEKSAIAFNELIHFYENNKIGHRTYKSPFFFGNDLRFESAFFLGIKDRKLAGFVDKVKESIEAIQNAIKITSLGIDYKKYSKFRILTPIVTRVYDDHHVSEIYGKKKWDKENCQYCIDFVIESALKLQEFDFEIAEIEEQEEIELIIKSTESNKLEN
jgi:hypothetical protein